MLQVRAKLYFGKLVLLVYELRDKEFLTTNENAIQGCSKRLYFLPIWLI